MKAVLAFLAAVAVALELITDQIKRYVEQKKQTEIQNKHDAIDCDPARMFLRKFRDKNPPTDTNANPGERDNDT